MVGFVSIDQIDRVSPLSFPTFITKVLEIVSLSDFPGFVNTNPLNRKSLIQENENSLLSLTPSAGHINSKREDSAHVGVLATFSNSTQKHPSSSATQEGIK